MILRREIYSTILRDLPEKNSVKEKNVAFGIQSSFVQICVK